MNNISKSKELFEKIQDLEKKLPGIEKERLEAIQNAEMQRLTLTMLIAERLLEPSHPEIHRLHKEFEETKRIVNRKKTANLEEHGRLCKDLEALTRPVIGNLVKKLHSLMASLSVNREIIDRRIDGLHNRVILLVLANQNGVERARKEITRGIKNIRGMSLQSIEAIQKEGSRIEQAVKNLNVDAMERLEMDETEYFRGSPPKGPDVDFRGPLSGLR